MEGVFFGAGLGEFIEVVFGLLEEVEGFVFVAAFVDVHGLVGEG